MILLQTLLSEAYIDNVQDLFLKFLKMTFYFIPLNFLNFIIIRVTGAPLSVGYYQKLKDYIMCKQENYK